MTSQSDKCANTNCGCPAEPGKGYCSDYCMHSNDDSDTRTACGCGHAACTTAAGKTQPAGTGS